MKPEILIIDSNSELVRVTSNNIKTAFLLIIASIGIEYAARDIALLLIASFLGVFLLFKNHQVYNKDIKPLLYLFVVHFGVIVYKLFYSHDASKLIDLVFLFQLFLFSFFAVCFLTKYSIPKSFLLLTSFFYLPHLIGLITGWTPMQIDQFSGYRFGGFHKDPNYLSSDLLFSFLSQIFVFYQRYKFRIKMMNAFNLLLTVYMIMLTGSRTATLSVLLIILLFVLLRISSQKGLYRKLGLPILIIFFVIV